MWCARSHSMRSRWRSIAGGSRRPRARPELGPAPRGPAGKPRRCKVHACVRFTQLLVPTLKDDPADAEVVSHKLLVRAAMIRQVARGIYDYLPLGLRVLRNVENIV